MGKIVRIEGLDELFNAKRILVPAESTWYDDLVNELVTFPKGRHDDMIDALSYAKMLHIQPGGCKLNLTDMLTAANNSSTVF